MSDTEKIFTALGQLQESVKTIQKNTDKLPDLATEIALVKNDVKYMKPKVERHQKVMLVGSGIAAVFSIAWTAALAWLSGGGGKP